MTGGCSSWHEPGSSIGSDQTRSDVEPSPSRRTSGKRNDTRGRRCQHRQQEVAAGLLGPFSDVLCATLIRLEGDESVHSRRVRA